MRHPKNLQAALSPAWTTFATTGTPRRSLADHPTHRDTMRPTLTSLALVLALPLPVSLHGQGGTAAVPIPLNASTPIALTNARILWVEYRGRPALKLAPREGHERDQDQEMIATLTGSNFGNGTIEVDVAGSRRSGYSTTGDSTGFKGFIGISFRVRGDSAERFYLRPENSRLDDQVFRNRSTQYEADPGYQWQRLRRESPGTYESYVDLEPGAWTKVKIEVKGTTARLFVNGASQPSLVVNDLKLGDGRGKVALWARISSEAYFSNLRVASDP
jgi:hypothetical protein